MGDSGTNWDKLIGNRSKTLQAHRLQVYISLHQHFLCVLGDLLNTHGEGKNVTQCYKIKVKY